MRRRMVAVPEPSAGASRACRGARDGVQRSLTRRIRWGNVGRLAAVLGVAALVVAWPRLAPAPPGVPADEPVAVEPAPTARPDGVTAPRRDAKKATERRARRGAAKPRRGGTKPRRGGTSRR